MKRFALLIIGLILVQNTLFAAVPQPEKDALVAFYYNTGGTMWTTQTNWLTGDPCADNWYGLSCDQNAHITHLDLADNNLVGFIPLATGDLVYLKYLDLGNNQLSNMIPQQLGNLTRLKTLSLTDNLLDGPIPSTFGNLTKLVSLYLSTNQLSGSIPISFENLVDLQSLNMAENQLSGEVPNVLGNLPRLNFLFLGDNSLTGAIPAGLGKISTLKKLGMSDNKFSGLIPVALGQLANLQQLYLAGNQLSGPVPASLANLASLTSLGLSWNALYTGNASLNDFLDSRSGRDWSTTQTIAPRNIVADQVGTDWVRLSWDAIEFHDELGNYIISKSTTPEGPFTHVGDTTTKMDDNFPVNGLTPGRYYFEIKTQTAPHDWNSNTVTSKPGIKVRIFVNGLEGGLIDSNPKNFRASHGTYRDRVELTWDAVGGATVYRVYHCETTAMTNCGLPVGFSQSTAFSDTRATPGVTYYYRVRACVKNRCGKYSVARKGSIAVGPGVPKGIVASDGVYENHVSISWNVVVGAGVYRVFRCMSPDTESCGPAAGFPKTNSMNDSKGTYGTVYYYRVKACEGNICGRYSVADAGHRGTASTAMANDAAVRQLDVPIPALSSAGRWLLILIMLGIGLPLTLRTYRHIKREQARSAKAGAICLCLSVTC